MKKRDSLPFFLLFTICFVFAFSGTAAYAETSSATFLFINVGKADAAVVQFGGYCCMVDTGTKDSFAQLSAVLSKRQIEEIDDVFLSHSHDDHIGGFKKLCKSFKVGRMLHSGFVKLTDKGKNRFSTLAEKNDIPHETLIAGAVLTPCEGLQIDVLGPLAAADDDNDQSLVLRFTAYGKRVLFTGDMQFIEEFSLIKAGVDLQADVLKVGNHGNPDATSEAFAAAVSPSVSVISTNTEEDRDSANQRVLGVLRNSDCYLTQDYQTGVLVTISPDGTIAVEGID